MIRLMMEAFRLITSSLQQNQTITSAVVFTESVIIITGRIPKELHPKVKDTT